MKLASVRWLMLSGMAGGILLLGACGAADEPTAAPAPTSTVARPTAVPAPTATPVPTVPTIKRGGTLRYAYNSDAENMSPLRHSLSAGATYTEGIYGMLVGLTRDLVLERHP